jgi:chlorite dismutase
MMRLGEMDRRWPMASPEERSELMVEYGAIDRQWPRAPA